MSSSRRASSVSFLLVSVLYSLGYTITDAVLTFRALRLSTTSKHHHHASPWQYSTAMSAYSIAKMVCAPWIGHFSDGWGRGRRLPLVFTFAGTALSFAGTALFANTLPELIAWRLLTGCFGSNGALMTARISDVTPPGPQRITYFSRFRQAWALAYTIAAPCVAALGEDFSVTFAAAACLNVLAATVCFFCFREDVCTHHDSGNDGGGVVDGSFKAKTKTKTRGPSPSSWSPSLSLWASLQRFTSHESFALVAMLFVTGALSPREDYGPLLRSGQFGSGAGATELSTIKMVNAIVALLLPVTPLVDYVAGRYGNRGAAAIGSLGAAVVVATFPAAAGSFPRLLAGVALLSVMTSIGDPARSAFVNDQFEQGVVGASIGWQHCLKGITSATSTFVSSWLFSLNLWFPFIAIAAKHATDCVIIANAKKRSESRDSNEKID